MTCLCFSRRQRRQDIEIYFHWPNFTFAHSQETLDSSRRNHSTYNIKDKHHHPSGRRLKRRHTLDGQTILKLLGRRKNTCHSFSSNRTAPPAVSVRGEMSGSEYAPPPGPPPGYRGQRNGSQGTTERSSELASNNPFRSAHNGRHQKPHQPSLDPPPEYEAPPGPPPGHIGTKAPAKNDDEYAPPAEPPPGHASKAPDDYAPPPGPAPRHQNSADPEPPPYDPWLAIPDTALLPPPPSFAEDKSPATNASWDDAAHGREWCRRNPLWRPRRQNQATLARIANGDIRITAPPSAKVKDVQLSYPGVGRSHIRTTAACPDMVLLSDIPLYAAASTPPDCPATIYFELHIHSLGIPAPPPPQKSKTRWLKKPTPAPASLDEEPTGTLSLGFLAPPYPSFRQPGWHRASLGVHSDDGRRYVDDSFGGKPFTAPFRAGETVGIGMTISPPRFVEGRREVEIFFTREGKRVGGWDLHEERDREQDGGTVEGLEGERDLLGAVGVFGAVEAEVKWGRGEWMFVPPGL